MDDHRARYLRLASILTQRVGDLMSTWDAGEWAMAVEDLGVQFAEYHTPLNHEDRTDLLEFSAWYDVAEKVRPSLRWCPDPDAPDEWWREIEESPRASYIVQELTTEIAPGHPLFGVALTPWLECGACADVLVRLDEANGRKPGWRYQVAVVHPTWSHHLEPLPWPATVVFDKSLPALDRLEACHHPA